MYIAGYFLGGGGAFSPHQSIFAPPNLIIIVLHTVIRLGFLFQMSIISSKSLSDSFSGGSI